MLAAIEVCISKERFEIISFKVDENNAQLIIKDTINGMEFQ